MRGEARAGLVLAGLVVMSVAGALVALPAGVFVFGAGLLAIGLRGGV